MIAHPSQHFDESVGLDDPIPFPGWLPSPEQIRRWAAQIRAENDSRKASTGGAHSGQDHGGEFSNGDSHNHGRPA